MRPVDADALIEDLEECNKVRFDTWPYDSVIQKIKEAPTIEAEERPSGEWEYSHYGYLSLRKCSNCCDYGNPLWRFCPWCGAKMKEGDEK